MTQDHSNSGGSRVIVGMTPALILMTSQILTLRTMVWIMKTISILTRTSQNISGKLTLSFMLLAFQRWLLMPMKQKTHVRNLLLLPPHSRIFSTLHPIMLLAPGGGCRYCPYPHVYQQEAGLSGLDTIATES